MSIDHSPVLERLSLAESKGRLGHALLFISAQAQEKAFNQSLIEFCKSLMCVSPQNFQPCGTCESCAAFQNSDTSSAQHIDFYHLRPEKLNAYVVDQIKELRSFLSLKKALGRIKVIYIEEAEALGSGGGAPANALLKILEEPRDEIKLILSSSRPEGILPTIRSRCQSFRLTLEARTSGFDEHPPELIEAWDELFRWIDRGAPARDWPQLSLPADKDSFFKDRDSARETLKSVFLLSWERCRQLWPQWDLEASRDVLDWFHAFEQLMSSLKAYGQAGLQWSAFKYRDRS